MSIKVDLARQKEGCPKCHALHNFKILEQRAHFQCEACATKFHYVNSIPNLQISPAVCKGLRQPLQCNIAECQGTQLQTWGGDSTRHAFFCVDCKNSVKGCDICYPFAAI